jgi:S-adenosylmethionine-diacylglycerol 3-amino-3-carboxypropyl transferase
VFGAIQESLFKVIHGNNLVYNTCWEDPRLDREALTLSGSDKVVMITSAGCNALDYLLAGAGHVYAVDVNPRQNALLELKKAAILEFSHEELFAMFGRGVLPDYQNKYKTKLRKHLSAEAQFFWDDKIKFFSGKGWQKSFYFRGSSGFFAKLINVYIDRNPNLRSQLEQLFASSSLEEQSSLYFSQVKPRFWGPFVKWIVGRDLTLALLGVPKSQRIEIDTQYQGGVVKFIEDCIDNVFGRISLKDNYFWRLYVFGEYSEECCPEYLKESNNEKLKSVVRHGVSCHTMTISQFLKPIRNEITRFVLLDHMDWLSAKKKEALQQEWQAIFDAARPGARCIWRSGGVKVEYVDPLVIDHNEQKRTVGELISYQSELAQKLHVLDRVHTYGSFYIADLHIEAANKDDVSNFKSTISL